MKTINSKSLIRTLKLNALFTSTSAILLIVFNRELMPLLSISVAWLLPVIGGLLLLYALDLFTTARKKETPLSKAYYFIIGDLAWVVASILLLTIYFEDFSSLGILLIDMVAIIVGIFGILQFRYVSKANSSQTAADIG